MNAGRHYYVRAGTYSRLVLLGLAIAFLPLTAAARINPNSAPFLPPPSLRAADLADDASLAAAGTWSQSGSFDGDAFARLSAASSSTPATQAITGPAGTTRNAVTRAQIERWRGRYCPPAGCPAPSPARPADIAAFGCVVFASARLARRRVPNPS